MADISYNKTTWVNGSTALNADNLNNIEIGLDNATKTINKKADKQTQPVNISNVGDDNETLTVRYQLEFSADTGKISAGSRTFDTYTKKAIDDKLAAKAPKITTGGIDIVESSTSGVAKINQGYTYNADGVLEKSIKYIEFYPKLFADKRFQTKLTAGENITLVKNVNDDGYTISASGGSDVGIVELTDSQAQTLSADNKITFTTEQAEILKTHQLIIVRYGSAIEYKGFVSRIYTQGQADAYTIFMFLDYILYTIAITDFTAEQTLNSVTFPTSYTFSYDDSVNALIWSDGDYDRPVHLSTINGNPIAFNNAQDVKNYSFTEDKTISLFGDHSILVPKNSADTSILPCTTADNGKVLSVVNGEAQWASAGSGGKSVPPTLWLFDFETVATRTSITEEEYNNLMNGLYNQVEYAVATELDLFSPSKLFFINGTYYFIQFKIVENADGTSSYSSLNCYTIEIGEKNASNEYPITITKSADINPASSGGVTVTFED